MIPVRRFIEASDGTKLCLWEYVPNETPKALVVIFHGFLAHAHYPTVQYAVELLKRAGFAVFCGDLRGHGESEGDPGYLDSSQQILKDAMLFVETAVHAFPGIKAFLVGSSMGGTLALYTSSILESSNIQIDGIVMLAPMLKLNVSGIARSLLYGLSYILPMAKLIPSSSTDSSKQYRDPMKRRLCEEDSKAPKLTHLHVASANTCVQLAHGIHEQFSSVTTPLLIMVADEDVVVDNAGSDLLMQTSPSKDKTLLRYPALHGLLCEPKPLVDKIQDDILEWIHHRL